MTDCYKSFINVVTWWFELAEICVFCCLDYFSKLKDFDVESHNKISICQKPVCRNELKPKNINFTEDCQESGLF